MTDRQLRKLSRRDLLELLVDEMEENEKLREQLDRAQKELEDRRLVFENSGSLAEAALKLSGIFDAADKAAKIYKDNYDSVFAAGRNHTGLSADRGKKTDGQK